MVIEARPSNKDDNCGNDSLWGMLNAGHKADVLNGSVCVGSLSETWREISQPLSFCGINGYPFADRQVQFIPAAAVGSHLLS